MSNPDATEAVSLKFLVGEVVKGRSVLRSFLNDRLKSETLVGSVVDIGGGSDEDYIKFMDKSQVEKFLIDDVKVGSDVDYEKDSLPYANESCDTVLFLNVMEHIFNYQHISDEVYRITAIDGKMLGFTPFLMRYHGDPQDYFRYTNEALRRILAKSGWNEIKINPVGMGPFMAATHQFLRSFPVILRVPIFIFFYFSDWVFIRLRPHATSQYVLGYYFETKK